MKAISVMIGALFISSIILSGCEESDYSKTVDYNETPIPKVMSGSVTGSAESVYTLSGGTVTCTDSAAEYTLSLAKDNKIPGDSTLTGPLPEFKQYFRLDIMAVMRILEDGKCLERDPSDDRVHVVMEGYYDGATREFTPLNCSKGSTLSKADMSGSSDYVVFGQITCVYSEQMKYNFYLSNLALK